MLYQVVLFTHFLGLIGIFGGFILYHRAVARLRAASTREQALGWLGLLSATSPMLGGGLVILVLSGLILGYLRWEGTFPFMAVGLAAVVLIGVLTGTSAGRWVRRIRLGLDNANRGGASLSPDVAQRIAEPGPWIATSVATGLALATVWLMTTKPDWTMSILVTAGAGIAGALIGSAVTKRPAVP